MTFDHIPEEPGRKKNPKTIADTKTKLNFPPFQHYKFNENDELVCVGKSHWVGGMENGHFDKTHGMATNKLAMMWMKLCERYATRGNVRGYTYNDEMKGQAILQLSQIGLQFDESKSQNPFAYFTQIIWYAFLRRIQKEKKQMYIRFKSSQSMIATGGTYVGDEVQLHLNTNADYMNAFVQDFEDKLTRDKEKKK